MTSNHNQKVLKFFFSFSIVLFLLNSCSKGDDFLTTDSYPLNWKMVDTFTIVGHTIKDTISAIGNRGFTPFGIAVDNNFGMTKCGFYAQYQTTNSSQTFQFSSIDSIVLIVPYLFLYGQADKPINLSVYEMTEPIVTATINTQLSYGYKPTPLGSISNFIPDMVDSVVDGVSTIAPALRVKLDPNLASRIVAPGSYSDNTTFQSIFQGLYVTSTSTTSSNGFVYMDLSSSNRIVIYGKNSTGDAITSVFTTGGTYSNNVNDYQNDATSPAFAASANYNPTGDSKIYLSGAFGEYGRLVMPDLTAFAKDKNIFKVELVLSSIDTGYSASPNLGICNYDSSLTTNKEAILIDEYYISQFRVPNKDTSISGSYVKQYVFNISNNINRIISYKITNSFLNIYSSAFNVLTSPFTKNTRYYPSRVVLGGKDATKPKLRIFYTPK